ncbi:threonine ammonia-lyase [Aquipuribacter nitratireducens]|uniref:threonine ammonia-lyase n=1 Tax=Aquipuribacter nitratireducens TaxID=650104 RepID=A0ABW0GK69_9MICO
MTTPATTPTVPAVPDAADRAAARARLTDVVRRTPVVRNRALSDLVGGDVWLKCENLQRAGSFKIRGAYTRISRLSEAERARGVVAASAGNHAQGVALAASLLGTRATVFMPVGAALPKVAATKAYGATVEHVGRSVDEALVAAREMAERTGAVLVHPFDHVDVVAGQASLGAEVLEQVPDARTVLVCTGGGGLLAGIALEVAAARDAGRAVRLVGVQAASAAAYPASLAAGHPVALERMSTMADGIAVGRPGQVPFGIVRDHVDDIRTVTEEDLSRALVLLLERAKLVVEPAGAAAVAAVMADPRAFEPPVVAVLSGGNVDPLVLHRVLRHGLVAAGRYLQLRVAIADRPGELGHLLELVGSSDANLVEVEHRRTEARLHVDEVEVALQLETRGGEHRDAVIACLREAGYAVQVD